LEVDIITRIMHLPENDLSLFYEMALALALATDPKKPMLVNKRLQQHPEICKALRVIGELRTLSHTIATCNDFREYLWGLLFDALFVYVITSESLNEERKLLQRDRALLLGTVLCGRLQHPEDEWLPADWPRPSSAFNIPISSPYG
jgi:hypothetical protein